MTSRSTDEILKDEILRTLQQSPDGVTFNELSAVWRISRLLYPGSGFKPLQCLLHEMKDLVFEITDNIEEPLFRCRLPSDGPPDIKRGFLDKTSQTFVTEKSGVSEICKMILIILRRHRGRMNVMDLITYVKSTYGIDLIKYSEDAGFKRTIDLFKKVPRSILSGSWNPEYGSINARPVPGMIYIIEIVHTVLRNGHGEMPAVELIQTLRSRYQLDLQKLCRDLYYENINDILRQVPNTVILKPQTSEQSVIRLLSGPPLQSFLQEGVIPRWNPEVVHEPEVTGIRGDFRAPGIHRIYNCAHECLRKCKGSISYNALIKKITEKCFRKTKDKDLMQIVKQVPNTIVLEPDLLEECIVRVPPGLHGLCQILSSYLGTFWYRTMKLKVLETKLSMEHGIHLKKLSFDLGYKNSWDFLQQARHIRAQKPTEPTKCLLYLQKDFQVGLECIGLCHCLPVPRCPEALSRWKKSEVRRKTVPKCPASMDPSKSKPHRSGFRNRTTKFLASHFVEPSPVQPKVNPRPRFKEEPVQLTQKPRGKKVPNVPGPLRSKQKNNKKCSANLENKGFRNQKSKFLASVIVQPSPLPPKANPWLSLKKKPPDVTQTPLGKLVATVPDPPRSKKRKKNKKKSHANLENMGLSGEPESLHLAQTSSNGQVAPLAKMKAATHLSPVKLSYALGSHQHTGFSRVSKRVYTSQTSPATTPSLDQPTSKCADAPLRKMAAQFPTQKPSAPISPNQQTDTSIGEYQEASRKSKKLSFTQLTKPTSLTRSQVEPTGFSRASKRVYTSQTSPATTPSLDQPTSKCAVAPLRKTAAQFPTQKPSAPLPPNQQTDTLIGECQEASRKSKKLSFTQLTKSTSLTRSQVDPTEEFGDVPPSERTTRKIRKRKIMKTAFQQPETPTSPQLFLKALREDQVAVPNSQSPCKTPPSPEQPTKANKEPPAMNPTSAARYRPTTYFPRQSNR